MTFEERIKELETGLETIECRIDNPCDCCEKRNELWKYIKDLKRDK